MNLVENTVQTDAEESAKSKMADQLMRDDIPKIKGAGVGFNANQ